MGQRPRLLVVGPVPPPVHGVSAYVRSLLDARELRERWEVLHLDTSDHRSLANLGRVDPTNVVLALRHVAECARRVRRERVRVVWIPISSNAPAYLRDALFILGAHAGGACVVAHAHGGGFGAFYRQAAPPVRWLVERASARVERAWVLGEGLRAMFDGLVADDRVHVVPNGVPDPTLAAGTGGAADARSAHPFTLLHLGQLSVAKGVVDLVEAAGRLAASGTEIRVLLAGGWGSPGDEARIGAAVTRSGLGARVELLGVVSGATKAAAFRRADAFVLATRYPYEGQPLAVLEAMAAGLAVVSTPRAAIPDAVTDGVTGLLAPEGDVDALTAALLRLAADREVRVRMGAEGRRRWEREFTAERAMARVADALEEIRAGSFLGKGVGA